MLALESTTFKVPFVRGKERPRFARGRVYTPRVTQKAEEEIGLAYKAAGGTLAPKGVPVTVSITVHKAPAKSTPKRVLMKLDLRKPDLDNVIKLVLDGLNGVAYEDDSQVVSIDADRVWSIPGEEDATLITVSTPARTNTDWILTHAK